MKTLCKRSLILIALSILLVPSAMAFPIASGDDVQMNASYSNSNGYPYSPYTITVDPNSTNPDVFTSFCLEKYVTFNNNGDYTKDHCRLYYAESSRRMKLSFVF